MERRREALVDLVCTDDKVTRAVSRQDGSPPEASYATWPLAVSALGTHGSLIHHTDVILFMSLCQSVSLLASLQHSCLSGCSIPLHFVSHSFSFNLCPRYFASFLRHCLCPFMFSSYISLAR